MAGLAGRGRGWRPFAAPGVGGRGGTLPLTGYPGLARLVRRLRGSWDQASPGRAGGWRREDRRRSGIAPSPRGSR